MAVGLFVAVLLVPALVILFARDWFADRQRRSPEHLAREKERILDGLRAPDWAEVERELEMPVPSALRDLYDNQELVTQFNLEIQGPAGDPVLNTWDIAHFNPPHEDALDGEMFAMSSRAFAFATSHTGDVYFVDLEERDDAGGPVRLAHHDGGDIEDVAPTLTEFLSWPRTTAT